MCACVCALFPSPSPAPSTVTAGPYFLPYIYELIARAFSDSKWDGTGSPRRPGRWTSRERTGRERERRVGSNDIGFYIVIYVYSCRYTYTYPHAYTHININSWQGDFERSDYFVVMCAATDCDEKTNKKKWKQKTDQYSELARIVLSSFVTDWIIITI